MEPKKDMSHVIYIYDIYYKYIYIYILINYICLMNWYSIYCILYIPVRNTCIWFNRGCKLGLLQYHTITTMYLTINIMSLWFHSVLSSGCKCLISSNDACFWLKLLLRHCRWNLYLPGQVSGPLVWLYHQSMMLDRDLDPFTNQDVHRVMHSISRYDKYGSKLASFRYQAVCFLCNPYKSWIIMNCIISC